MQILYLGGSLIDYSEISIDTSILVIEEKVKKLFTVYYDIYKKNQNLLNEAWLSSSILKEISSTYPAKTYIKFLKEQLSSDYSENYIKKQLEIINKFDISVEGYLEVFNVFQKVMEPIVKKIITNKEDYFLLQEYLKKIMFLDLKIISKRRILVSSLQNDSLTGLSNLKNFLSMLEQKINTVLPNESLIVIVFDIQKFTKIKEIFGYLKADIILVKIKDLISVITERYFDRSQFIFSRTGFDEFSIAIKIKNFDILNAYLNKIKNEFNEPIFVTDKEIYINLAKGGALFPKNATNPDDLLKYAKIALSVSKNKRNKFIFYSTKYMEALKDIFDLETSIRNAIKNKEFELYYQPKIDFRTGKISGVEALVRWNHPQKGIVYPKDFIPFLEESKLIIEVGKWIFEQACIQSNIWKTKGIDLKIAINISQLQLKQDDFIDFISKTLKDLEVSSNDIEIELTESLSINMEDDIEKLKKVKDMGISISIDDFGTGYSSLSYLENLPISKIKIDLMFVQNLDNARNREITETIINLANKLNLKTISEGIETIEQLELLKSLKCDEGQGYYFSKPVSALKIEEIYDGLF